MSSELHVAVKLNFQGHTSSNENFEYGYLHFNAPVTFFFKSQNVAAASFIKTTCQPIKRDVTKLHPFSDKYITGIKDILSQMYDAIQSNITLHLHVY